MWRSPTSPVAPNITRTDLSQTRGCREAGSRLFARREGGNATKIAILGHSGSGKSTLARELGARDALPVLHFDSIQFRPGWVEIGREEKREKTAAFLAENPGGWVLDGNYLRICPEERFSRADVILYLDFPRRMCLRRVLSRWRTYRGVTRPDMAPGCPEKIDREFLRWILWEGRRPARLAGIAALGEQYPRAFVRLTSPRALEA